MPDCPELPGVSRRGFLLATAALCLVGCDEDSPTATDDRLDGIWGVQGQLRGQLQKPRALTIDGQDRLYIVDITARIQVFDRDGKYLHGWQTPDSQNGRPTGLSLDRVGNVLVADTHYFRLLVYTPEGKLLDQRIIGGKHGNRPGEFGFVTDAAEDSQGNIYISEYGEWDRVQKFTPQGKYLLEFGGHGAELGQFRRPQKIYIDQRDEIWVADACNHRIAVFDTSGKLLRYWGEEGAEPGKLRYPYDITFDRKEENLYLIEYGNHRVQKFTREGKSLACWGTHGRGPGEMHNPWGVVVDSQGMLHVLDSNNHRVQRVWL